MQPPDPAGVLRDVGNALGLELSAFQVDGLVRYLALLQRWNATYNLTAVRNPAEMLTQHLADCLAVVPALRRWRQQQRQAQRLLDVGSGGGLPGIVLAVLEPDLRVTCVDTVGKKASFVRQVALELQLRNLEARHARVETLNEGGFDIVVSRAFASVGDFTELTAGALAAAGVWLAMKGKQPAEELAALPPSIDVFHVERLAVPGLNADRCLVWMRRRSDAPKLA